MSVATAIDILRNVQDQLTELAQAEYDLDELTDIFADEAELRGAAPIYWAAEKIGAAIQLLSPDLGD